MGKRGAIGEAAEESSTSRGAKPSTVARPEVEFPTELGWGEELNLAGIQALPTRAGNAALGRNSPAEIRDKRTNGLSLGAHTA